MSSAATSMAVRILADIEASPTPYHAVRRAAERLADAGFVAVAPDAALADFPGPGAGGYLRRQGALVAWWCPETVPGRAVGRAADGNGDGPGFVVVGAHTDSPNLRLRANAEATSAGWSQLGVEVYGGVLLNSWLDRDLGLAGRVVTDDAVVLVREPDPVLRIPQLAIHLDRAIRDTGLLLDPQQHLTPLWALDGADGPDLATYLGELAKVGDDEVRSWELMAYDVQPPAVIGRDRDLFASARIDNQLSCFAGVEALIASAGSGGGQRIAVLALYDHEEVGSASATGADGGLLTSVLERISASLGADRDAHLRALARSVVVSADGAHATHPNYADRHEPSHHIAVNQGVVVKRNVNQRYATDAESEGWFRGVCAAAGVPVQTYIHRNDLPCGSTIGPLTAAMLGVSTVDVGVPQLAMHSVREMAGLVDVEYLVAALSACWST